METASQAASDDRLQSAEPQFLWIENDGLLRDEGVVFGLSDDAAALAHKEDVIRAYYRSCSAASERRAALLLQELEFALGERERLRASPASAARDAAAMDDDAAPGLLVRHASGVLAALLACGGITVFTWEQLRPEFVLPALVTAGVVAGGFFTSFLPVASLFVGDARRRPGDVELWKVRLAEFGVPLAAAAFVVAWSWTRLGVVRGAATAALLFLVFAFAGRQVLSGLLRMGAVRAARRRMAELERSVEAAQSRARGLDERVTALRREMLVLRSPAEWDAVRDAKLALFRSEYQLAAAHTRAGFETAVYATPGGF